MIHIVFNEADVNVLQKAIELDESLAGDIIQIKDDYAVGPIKDIYSEETIQARKQWWLEVLAGGDYEGFGNDESIDDNKIVVALKKRLNINAEKVIWIWAAQNKHDVSGY